VGWWRCGSRFLIGVLLEVLARWDVDAVRVWNSYDVHGFVQHSFYRSARWFFFGSARRLASKACCQGAL
jgi:hypothetical protein